MLGKRKGQSTVEYGLLIAVVIIALLAINVYLKRGVSGKLKESTDQIGKQFDASDYTTSWRTQGTGQTVTTENRTTGTGSTTSATTGETITRTEHETFGNTTPGQHF